MSAQATLQAAAHTKKSLARWLRERAAEHREHAARLDAQASDLLQEAANLERIIDAEQCGANLCGTRADFLAEAVRRNYRLDDLIL